MPVPDFQSFFRPMLRYIAEHNQRSLAEIRDHLKGEFNLTDEDLLDMLPSGVRSRFADRVYWANTHLFQSRLVTRPSNGILAITERGKQFLNSHSEKILVSDLLQFPEYAAFRGKGPATSAAEVVLSAPVDKTPQERMDEAFNEMRESMGGELLSRIMDAPPVMFEKLVLQLLVRMGYGGGKIGSSIHLGGSGDGGVDGVINQDALGLDRVYIQAKRWKDPVGIDRVHAFVGSLESRKASKGVILTTSTFTDSARKTVEAVAKNVVLIDGRRLVELMMDFQLGVRVTRQYELLAVDSDLFDELD